MNTRFSGIRSAVVAASLSLAASALGPARAQTMDATMKVVCVAQRNAADVTHKRPCLHSVPRVSFGEEITLAVEHAPEYDFDDSSQPNPARLVLFLQGKALPGTFAQVGTSQMDEDDVTTTLLTFRIARDLSGEIARANWKQVLVAAQNQHVLTVSTGLEDGAPAMSEAQVEFIVMRPQNVLFSALFALVLAIAFFTLAARTGMLRDKEPARDAAMKPTDRAFSLGRVQAAFWTVLVLCAYVFVWFLTGEYNGTIPASAVALMGISLATAAGAAAIDADKVKSHKEKLAEKRAKLAAQPNDADLHAEVEKLEERAYVCKSEGFFRDISTSAEGATLHRLQFIVWTLALAVVFVVTVWKTIAIPDFDVTLLGLMGITSGTYVGLKLPEAKT